MFDDYGQNTINVETDKLRNILSRTINQCNQTQNATISESVRHFCDYHDKNEFEMIDEVRSIQRKKSVEVILRSQQDSKISR